MWFLLLFRIHTCMSVQYTRNILQYLLGHYLTHRQGVSTYFSRDHLNCHSKSLLNQKQKKGNKDSLVLIKGNRIQFLKLPNYYNNLLYATIAAQPPNPSPPSHSGPMSKVILKYDQYQIHNTTARSHAQVSGNECNDQRW